MLATPVAKPFDRARWLFELKYALSCFVAVRKKWSA